MTKDPTEKIVLGVSLLITVVMGYFCWSTREANIKIKRGYPEEGIEAEMDKKLDQLANTRDKYISLYEDQLLPASNLVGFKEYLVESKEEPEVGKSPFHALRRIEKLKQEGQLAEEARNVFKKRGFSEEKINEVTSDQQRTEELLTSIYINEWTRSTRTLTDNKAFAEFLNDALSILNMTKDQSEVELELNEDEKWEFNENGRLKSDVAGVTITRFLRELDEGISQSRSAIEDLKKKIENTREKEDEGYHSFVGAGNQKGKIQKVREKKIEEVEKLKSDISQSQKEIESLKEKKTERIQHWIQEINKREEEIDDKQETHKEQMVRWEKRRKKLQNRKEAILKRRRQFEARKKRGVDGKVLFVNQDTGVAFVDIGKKDGLLSGTEFNVYDLLKGGVRVDKGKIKVTRVFEDYAKVAIRSQKDPVNQPIQEEDLVFNEAFSRERKKIFVLAGFVRGKYNREMLKQVIREKGNRVDKEVTLKTTYLVIGEGYKDDPNYKKAKRLNIPIINQKHLERMLDLR